MRELQVRWGKYREGRVKERESIRTDVSVSNSVYVLVLLRTNRKRESWGNEERRAPTIYCVWVNSVLLLLSTLCTFQKKEVGSLASDKEREGEREEERHALLMIGLSYFHFPPFGCSFLNHFSFLMLFQPTFLFIQSRSQTEVITKPTKEPIDLLERVTNDAMET